LPQLQRARLLGDGRNDGYAWGDLGDAVHPDETSCRPSRTEGEFGRRMAVEVPHAARQRGIGAIERPSECRSKNPKARLGRIDLDPGVYGQEVVQAFLVVAVTGGDDHEIGDLEMDA